MAVLHENSVVTAKEIQSYFGISQGTSKSYGKITRGFYKKTPKEKITLGQVLKANNLEK